MDAINYKLNALSFVITRKCNLKCEFCTREATIDQENCMPLEFIKNNIKEALTFSDIKMINLTGGEPFLHPNLAKIIEMIVNQNLTVRINTNGHHFTDENIKMLNYYNVKLFTISLDSIDKNIHDNIRGVIGSFDKTVENLIKIRDEGYQFFIKATINQKNVNNILDLMKFVASLGAYGFSFGRVIPVGRAYGSTNNCTFWHTYAEEGRKCSQFAKTVPMKFLIDDPLRFIFDVRLKDILDENPTLSWKKIIGGCTAGTFFLYILPDGNVLACPALTISAGNIYQNTLKDIWFNSELLTNLRTRNSLNGNCGKCSYKNVCGGCRAYSAALNKNYLSDDNLCPHNNVIL